MTNPIKCKTLTVKFKDKNLQGIAVHSGEIQGVTHLAIIVSGGILQCNYMFLAAAQFDMPARLIPIKTIQWVVADLNEWMCENILE